MGTNKLVTTPFEELEKKFESENELNVSFIEKQNAGEKLRRKEEEVPVYMKVAAVVLALILVVGLVTLLALVVEWRYKRINALQSMEQDVFVHKNRLHNCTGELKQHDTLCCGKTSIVTSALVKQFSSEKFKDAAGARMLSETCEKQDGKESESKHVAKMVGLDLSRTTQQDGSAAHRVFWDDRSADNIVRGVEYHNGCFKIKRRGHYFLYSQVKLSRNREQAMVPGNGPFSLSINRYRNTKEKLLESSNSECDTSSSEDVTSSIGAVFELEEGDGICVDTSHPQNLVNSRESNNFGLYYISS